MVGYYIFYNITREQRSPYYSIKFNDPDKQLVLFEKLILLSKWSKNDIIRASPFHLKAPSVIYENSKIEYELYDL